MSDIAIEIKNLRKQYRLGTIGGRTLNAELQSWWAKKRGKEDPNTRIGQDTSRYGETFWALDGINLEIKKGEAVGIIGVNGAGKSTLLKILSRVTAPTEGDIWIDGRVASMLEVGTGFHGELTGRENIYMNGAILGMTRKEVDEKIESIIDFSECRQFIDTPVKRYSSGMYVKLAFAVASHLDAEVMVMDEVLAVGDMAFQKKCLGKMGDEAKGGKTVLYVSHNMATIRKLCTRCIVLQKGKMIFDGDVEKAINIYSDVYSNDLICDYDFLNFKRCGPEVGKRIFINRLRFVGKSIASFRQDEIIKIEIAWRAIEKCENIRIRMSIYSSDNNPIGMIYSRQTLNANKGTENKTCFLVEGLNLVEGLYYFWLEASIIDVGVDSLDYPQQRIWFEISGARNSFVWNKNIWGHIDFSNVMEIENK